MESLLALLAALPSAACGIGLFVLLGGAVWWMSRAGGRMQAEVDARIAAARRAEAEILGVRTAAMQDRNRLRTALILKLRVHAEGEPYETVGAWQIETARLPELQAGRRVPVKVAVDDRDTVFPALPGVTYELGNHRMWQQEQARRKKAP